MKQTYSFKALLALLACSSALSASADWEQVHSLPLTYAHTVTKEGVHLLSDYDFKRKGGIYFSEDGGSTWTKCDVRDYNYSKFYEGSVFIFALGNNGRIARSADGGRNWEVLNYTNALRGVIDDKGIDSCACYGMIEVNGVIYICDFNGGGILKSQDFGETWQLTDRQSMTFSLDGQTPMIDSFYNIMHFNDRLYAFGALSVWSYDMRADKWAAVPVRSNFMAVATIHDNKLVCGRSVQNVDPETEYLVWTEDGRNWNKINAPEAPTIAGISLNVRAIHSDGKYIYTTGPDGIRYRNEADATPEMPFYYCPDFYYTSDFGETWNLFDGLPQLSFPLTLTSDDKYVYAAVYTPREDDTTAGLWRLPKSDLAGSGVEAISATGNELEASLTGKALSFSRNVDTVKVYTLAGSLVLSASDCSSLNLDVLPAGTYVFQVVAGNGNVSGKFIL